jgi:predicted transcriptional regulator
MRKGRSKGVVVTGVAFERKLLKRLDALATRERRSRSFIVREALERELAFRDA